MPSSARQGQAPSARRVPGAGLLVVLGVLVPALVLVFALGPRRIALNLFVDDAFYYLATARNLVDGFGSTFDRIHPTNGYHPLWFVCLLPIMALTDPAAGLVGVLLVQASLVVGGALLGMRALEHLGIPRPATGIAFLLTVALGPVLCKALLSGMEGALLWMLFNAVLYLSTRIDPQSSTRSLLGFGVVAGLACLARLDTYPLCLAIGLGWTWLCHVQQAWRRWWRIVLVAGPVAALMASYVASNLIFFGTPITISSMTKMQDPGHLSSRHLGLLALVWVAPLLYSALVLRRGQGRAALAPFVALFAPALIVSMNLVLAPGEVFRIWFFLPEIILAWVVGAGLLGRLRSPEQWVAWAPQLALGGLLLIGLNTALALRWTDDQRFVQWSTLLRFAEEVSESVPEDAVLSGFDVGRVGYFIDHPVVNLDGLANGLDYVGVCGEGRLLAWLVDQRVDYVFNYAFREQSLIEARLEPCGPDEDWAGGTTLVRREAVEVARINQTLHYDLLKIHHPGDPAPQP